MTAEEALRQAEAEGLTLRRAESNSTGFWGVSFNIRPEATPYQAKLRRNHVLVTLGFFATAEEAALAYARTQEAHVVARESAAVRLRVGG